MSGSDMIFEYILCFLNRIMGLYSLSGRTSYRKISWSLEVARLIFRLSNLTGTSARAALPRCLSNFRAIRSLQHPISRLRDFKRSYGKTSVRSVNRGPVQHVCNLLLKSEYFFANTGSSMPGNCQYRSPDHTKRISRDVRMAKAAARARRELVPAIKSMGLESKECFTENASTWTRQQQRLINVSSMVSFTNIIKLRWWHG